MDNCENAARMDTHTERQRCEGSTHERWARRGGSFCGLYAYVQATERALDVNAHGAEERDDAEACEDGREEADGGFLHGHGGLG